MALTSSGHTSPKSELIYLASPYSHPSADVRAHRFRAVCAVAARLMNQGRIVYSPIAHNHPIAVLHALPVGWEFWERVDRRMLEAADVMLVLRLPGWNTSKGVSAEIAIMRDELKKPVDYIDA